MIFKIFLLACLSGCEDCVDGTSCSSCKTSTNPRSGLTCLCPTGYYDNAGASECDGKNKKSYKNKHISYMFNIFKNFFTSMFIWV